MLFCTELRYSSAVSAERQPSGLGEQADGPSSCDLPKPDALCQATGPQDHARPPWLPRSLPQSNASANPISLHHATVVSRAEHPFGLMLKILCAAVP